MHFFLHPRRNQDESRQHDRQHTNSRGCRLDNKRAQKRRKRQKAANLHRLLTQELSENPPPISHYPQKPRNTVGNSRIKLELFRAMNHIAQNVIGRRFPNVLRAASVSKNGSEAAASSQNPGFRRRRRGSVAGRRRWFRKTRRLTSHGATRPLERPRELLPPNCRPKLA